MEEGKKLHVVVFPWLAMGHLIPYMRLSNLLAQKGHQIYFISSPRNLSMLSKISPKLSSNVTLVPFPLPHVPNLPPQAESSADVTYNKQQLLKKAFDLLESPLTAFLQSTKPDWIIYDYAPYWLSSIAAKFGISRAFFSLFTAALLCIIGPPLAAMNGEDSRFTAEDFTVMPKWVPFESDVIFRLHEVSKYVEKTEEDDWGPSDTVRFGFAASGCDVVIIRSSPELEPEWFNLLQELYQQKPIIIPIGFLPPVVEIELDDDDDESNVGCEIIGWLDKQEAGSVIYVALGTEAALTEAELRELAFGLEKSMLPFIWVLRNFPGATQTAMEMLPNGFEERVTGRGIVYLGWVPQAKILSHESVGGLLTHCGWNSVIEGLMFGRVLVMFPCLNDQGLNARLLQGKKLGLEIPRNEQDGSFTSDSVAEVVRKAMVDNSGKSLRDFAKEMSGMFKAGERNDQLVEILLNYLEENRRSRLVD